MERRRLAFTLIELLIAVTIFSIIAVALYSSFNAGIRVWRRAEANMGVNHAVRLALEDLAKELRNAIDFTPRTGTGEETSQREEKSEEEELAEEMELLFSGTSTELIFVTLATRTLEDDKFRKELAKLNYTLNTKGEFIRSIAFQNQDFISTQTDKEILIEDLEELKFEYSYEGEDETSPPLWKEYWKDQKGIPLGVKIHLKVKRKERRPGEFLKTVFLPTGILGKEELISE